VALIVCALDRSQHDRKAFDCGVAALNRFLQTQAAKHQRQGFSRTFVLVDDDHPSRIRAFYSLSTCEIGRESLADQDMKGLPLHPVPCVMLARLAVDQSRQGEKLGQHMLMDAVRRAALVSQQAGVHAIVVDAKDAQAKRFYQRFGFRSVADHPLTLYLSLATALSAISHGAEGAAVKPTARPAKLTKRSP